MSGLIDLEQQGFESIIYDHGCDLCVTIVEWVDVLASGGGDFRGGVFSLLWNVPSSWMWSMWEYAVHHTLDSVLLTSQVSP